PGRGSRCSPSPDLLGRRSISTRKPILSGRSRARRYGLAMAVSEARRGIAVAAFVASYVGLALGRVPGFRIDRTGVAIIGATLMVVMGVLPWNDAVLAVDAHTVVLLFGMMIVAAYLRLSGFFDLVTMRAM